MTTEANDNDPRVSDAYHEMASEEPSAELDRKILSMAAAEASAAGGVPRAWLRPLAWAATVALSFALVLEISQVDDAPTPRADADLPEILEESPRADESAAVCPTRNQTSSRRCGRSSARIGISSSKCQRRTPAAIGPGICPCHKAGPAPQQRSADDGR